jgi:PleD family two-component response regulator
MDSSTRRDQQANPEVAPRPARRTGQTSATRRLTALLVAGHHDEADRYSVKLRLDGYAVVPATGVEQALERAAAARPDLIFVCVGPWAVPALILLVLRSDSATRDVPTVLVSDMTRSQLSAEVGGLLLTENVVPRHSAVHAAREERALTGRPAGCGHRPGWDQWLRSRR